MPTRSMVPRIPPVFFSCKLLPAKSIRSFLLAHRPPGQMYAHYHKNTRSFGYFMSNSKSGARDPLTINGKPEILIYKKSRPRQTGVATSLSRCVVKYSIACPAGSCKCFSTTRDFFRKSFDLCLPRRGVRKTPASALGFPCCAGKAAGQSPPASVRCAGLKPIRRSRTCWRDIRIKRKGHPFVGMPFPFYITVL